MLEDGNMSDSVLSEDETTSCLSLVTTPDYSHFTLSVYSNDAEKEDTFMPTTELEAPSAEDNIHLGTDNSWWCEYKIVADNIDRNITPSFQWLDWQKELLNYLHAYAVKDRVDMP